MTTNSIYSCWQCDPACPTPMALLTLSSNPFFTFTRLQPASRFCRGKSQGVCISGPVQCTGGAKTSSQTAVIVKRTANFQPSIWDYDYIQSLTSDYVVGANF